MNPSDFEAPSETAASTPTSIASDGSGPVQESTNWSVPPNVNLRQILLLLVGLSKTETLVRIFCNPQDYGLMTEDVDWLKRLSVTVNAPPEPTRP